MARQPLSSKYPKGSGFTIGHGHDTLAARPQAASLVSQCIAAWSEVEFQTGVLLATLLHANSEPVIALYFSLINERAKREAMLAIAEYCLVEQDKELFSLVVKAKESISKQRADLAHGLFCLIDKESSGIGWISMSDRTKYASTIGGGDADYSVLKNLIHIYTIPDLVSVLKETSDLQYLIINLRIYLDRETGHHKDPELFQKLWQSPLVQQFVPPKSSNPKIV
jgi:hypothetical protein